VDKRGGFSMPLLRSRPIAQESSRACPRHAQYYSHARTSKLKNTCKEVRLCRKTLYSASRSLRSHCYKASTSPDSYVTPVPSTDLRRVATANSGMVRACPPYPKPQHLPMRRSSRTTTSWDYPGDCNHPGNTNRDAATTSGFSIV